jgi:hypothetical protein
MEILLGIALFIVIAEGFAFGLLLNAERKEKSDLLNRLMAKDYREYSQVEHIKVVEAEKPSRNYEPEGLSVE